MSKKKIILISAIAGIFIGGLALLNTREVKQDIKSDKPKTEMTFALDWTPNTNHTGIYVAKNKGWYADQGIELKILPYSLSSPSDVLVSTGKADVGVGFTEGVVSSAATDSSVTSIAAIIANNTSVIITRKSDNITSLAQLDGKIYGGYGAPFEAAVVSRAIKNDGGKGDYKNVTIDTDPLDALENKRVDFAWVYDGWESIQAKRRGFEISKFPITEHGIPDYSTPNIISSPETIKNKADLLKKFMEATARGYEFARENPDEAARILIEEAPDGTFPDEGLVYESQQYLSGKYQQAGKKWGIQEPEFWQNYPKFMLEQKAVLDTSGKPVSSLDFAKLYTNQFLE